MKKRYNAEIYSTYSANTDVAILGASRASHHYVPSVIKDCLNLSATNYGINGQNIFVQYIVLKSLIEHSQKKPKLVILEIGYIDINDTPKWNTEKLSLLYPYYSEKYVKELLSDLLDPSELMVIKLSGLYRHNSNFLLYLRSIAKRFDMAKDGYRPLHNKWNEPIKFEKEQGDSILPKKIEYVEKFISLCKKENIKLVFASSPNFKLLPEQRWVEKVKEISAERGVPFLYHEKDTFYHKHQEWFNEPFHLNDEGAKIYTRQICGELQNLWFKN